LPTIITGQRPFPPFDRNPISPDSGIPNGLTAFVNSAAPHSAVTRATYTVPAGRVASVESAWGQVIRDTAATTPTTPSAFWWLISGVLSSYYLGELILSSSQNTIKDNASAFWHIDAPVKFRTASGTASMNLVDSDSSVGGTVTYSYGATIIEWDA
jgi:hypothetical protein